MLLGEHPTLEALEVDKSYRAFALAGNNERVLGSFFRTPTDSTLDVLQRLVNVLRGADWMCFPKFLLVELLFRHLLLVAAVVLDSESDSSQFNGVKFLNFVVIFAVFIFEGSCN